MEIQRLVKQIPAFMAPKRCGGSREGQKVSVGDLFLELSPESLTM